MGDSGRTDDIKGRVREAYGDLTNDQTQKNKGMVDRIAGKVKEGAEHLKEGVEHARQRVQEKIDERSRR